MTLALKLRREGLNQSEIAAKLERTPGCISRFFKRFFGTTELAEQFIKASSLKMAQKMVKHATVQETIEILSRPNIGVLAPAKQVAQGHQFIVSFGQDSIGGVEARPDGTIRVQGAPGHTLPPAPERATLPATTEVAGEISENGFEPEAGDSSEQGPSEARTAAAASDIEPSSGPATPQRRTRAQRPPTHVGRGKILQIGRKPQG